MPAGSAVFKVHRNEITVDIAEVGLYFLMDFLRSSLPFVMIFFPWIFSSKTVHHPTHFLDRNLMSRKNLFLVELITSERKTFFKKLDLSQKRQSQLLNLHSYTSSREEKKPSK